jgi:hypothetical protein
MESWSTLPVGIDNWLSRLVQKQVVGTCIYYVHTHTHTHTYEKQKLSTTEMTDLVEWSIWHRRSEAQSKLFFFCGSC